MGRLLRPTWPLLIAAGCATSAANRCPDAPVPHCLTETICENAPQRSCQVCRCAPPGYVSPSQAQVPMGGGW